VVNFKAMTSVPSHEVAFLYRIPVIDVSRITGNLRLSEEMSSHPDSENWGVKMQHLANLFKYIGCFIGAKCVGGNWVGMTVDCKWAGG